MPFNNLEHLKAKSTRELSDLLLWWQAREDQGRFVVVDQIAIIKMLLAERIGKGAKV